MTPNKEPFEHFFFGCIAETVPIPLREQRSIPQNKRLWLLYTAASEVTGYTPEELHEEMLCAHFGYTVVECKSPWTGEIETKRRPLKRSSTRDKVEFAKFMEFVEMFYGEKLGVWLPVREEAKHENSSHEN